MKRIKQFPNYSVTKDGQVYSHNRNKFLAEHFDGRGYLKVNLYRHGKSFNFRVHKLVAMAYLDYVPNGKQDTVIDHIDNVKTNNNLSNLQIITNRENTSKDRVGYSSRYVGVSWCKHHEKWLCRISRNGKNKHLGYFNCEDTAHKVYQRALKNIEK